jgi:hypothetical protein
VRAAVSTAVILRNFSNMTRLPRVLFGGEPALGLVVHELKRQTRHKLNQILRNWRSPYTRNGEDRRDTRLGVTTIIPRIPIAVGPGNRFRRRRFRRSLKATSALAVSSRPARAVQLGHQTPARQERARRASAAFPAARRTRAGLTTLATIRAARATQQRCLQLRAQIT